MGMKMKMEINACDVHLQMNNKQLLDLHLFAVQGFVNRVFHLIFY